MTIQCTLLQHYLINSATKYHDKTAIIFDNQKYSYNYINQASDNLASFLHRHGITRGDRVIVKLGNHIDTIIAFWAILKSDAIVSIIDPTIKEDKLIYILNNSSAKAFIIASITNELLTLLQQSCHNLSLVLTQQPMPTGRIQSLKTYELLAASLNNSDCLAVKSSNLSQDIAAIIYTSGSTGTPKGVTLTHRNMLAASHSINTYLENRDNDVIACISPISFDYGLYQIIMAFAVGATVVLEQDLIWPHLFIKNLIINQVTAIPFVPSMISLLDNYYRFRNHNLNKVRYVTNTGAALLVNHISALKRMFPKAKIYSMYGLTECKRCTYLPPADIDRKPNSIGIAIPNTELWLVDENDQKLGPGSVGQLVVRGETVMKGYWNDPIETAKKIKDGPIPFEKVLYTGDYAELDDDGYLYYRGRIDETIKSRGIKIIPKEIEDVISSHPAVKEVVVFGIEHEYYDQEICALVTIQSPSNTSPHDIRSHCKQRLEKPKVPTQIKILENLPKNANGKIDKQFLRQKIIEQNCYAS